MSTVCKSCKAPVRWTETDSGRSMPVDAEPTNAGNLSLIERGTEPPIVRYLNVLEAREAREAGRELWISHFATCPHAQRHRRPAPGATYQEQHDPEPEP